MTGSELIAGAIGAVFVGVIGLLKMLLPFIVKKRGAKSIAPPALPADTGNHERVMTVVAQLNESVTKLHTQDFATKSDIARIETKVDANAEKAGLQYGELLRAVSRLEGRMEAKQ